MADKLVAFIRLVNFVVWVFLLEQVNCFAVVGFAKSNRVTINLKQNKTWLIKTRFKYWYHEGINPNQSAVVYFDQLLGAARTHKLVKLLFSTVFNLFCPFQTFFSDFTLEINKKHVKLNKKRVLSYFAYSSKLVDMQELKSLSLTLAQYSLVSFQTAYKMMLWPSVLPWHLNKKNLLPIFQICW